MCGNVLILNKEKHIFLFSLNRFRTSEHRYTMVVFIYKGYINETLVNL